MEELGECCATCAYCLYVTHNGLMCFALDDECGVVSPIIDDLDCCNRYLELI